MVAPIARLLSALARFASVPKPLTIELATSAEAVSGPAPSASKDRTPEPVPFPITVTWRGGRTVALTRFRGRDLADQRLAKLLPVECATLMQGDRHAKHTPLPGLIDIEPQQFHRLRGHDAGRCVAGTQLRESREAVVVLAGEQRVEIRVENLADKHLCATIFCCALSFFRRDLDTDHPLHQRRILGIDSLPINARHILNPEVLTLQAPGFSKHLLPLRRAMQPVSVIESMPGFVPQVHHVFAISFEIIGDSRASAEP